MEKRNAPKGAKTQNHSTSVQRLRVLSALEEAEGEGLTTIELREQYDVMAPAPRVHELRWQFGYNIQLLWSKAANAQGNIHSCGRYFLLPGKWKEGQL